MKLPLNFSVLAALTMLFALHAGAQGLIVNPQPTPPGTSTPRQLTPEQIAKMPVRALPIRDFKLLNSNTGWVSTGNQLLLTTDSGAHWKDISPPTPALADSRDDRFSGVFFLDANTGWVISAADTDDISAYGRSVGSDALLSSTINGGATWSMGKLPRVDSVRELAGGGSIAFSDRLHGWFDLGLEGNAVVQIGVLFSTSDGGRTWSQTKNGPGVSADILALTDKDVWFAGGSDYKLFVTHDGANTVREVTLPVPAGIDSDDYPTYSLPTFTDRLNGYESVMYTGGNGDKSIAVLFATEDGGRTWKPDRILSNLVESLAGSRIRSTVVGSTWILPFASQGQPPTLLKLRPNDRIAAPAHKSSGDVRHCDVSFHTPDEGWMNCSGKLSSTIDGGSTWTEITPHIRNGVLTTAPVTYLSTPVAPSFACFWRRVGYYPCFVTWRANAVCPTAGGCR